MNDEISIIFAGDFCPFDGYEFSMDEDVRSFISNSNASFVNLECPLADGGGRIDKLGPNLKASASRVGAVRSFGFSGVCLANNHLRDYGDAALVETVESCKANGFDVVGAGCDSMAAGLPLIKKIKNKTIAFINACDHEFSIATLSKPGCNGYDIIDICRTIRDLSGRVDDIILVLHGGLEHVEIPSPESIRELRFLAEQPKVRAVIRHHAHVVQGGEIWNGVPIYYGLGNFLFPGKKGRPETWYHGLMVKVFVDSQGNTRCENLLTVYDRDGMALTLSVDKIGRATLESRSMLIANQDAYKAVWNKVVEERRLFYLSSLKSPTVWFLRAALKLKLFDWLWPSKVMKINLFGHTQCAAHREILDEIISGLYGRRCHEL